MKSNRMLENGQALVIIALSAVVLFGFVALAIDGSAKFSDRRHAQNAADTAALAGSLALVNEESDWKVYALDRAADNGYDNNLVSNQVWVFTCDSLVADRGGAPLNCGPYEGKDDYLSVIILSHVETTFARILGFTQTHNLVQAVSYFRVGGILGEGAMIISYDPDPNCSTGGTGGYSVEVTGSAEVNLTGGGIFINSDEVCGFKIPNCADLRITGGSAGINSVASVDNIDADGCTFTPPLNENLNQEAINIPDDVYFPDEPAECNSAAPTPTKLGDVIGDDGKWHEEWLIYPGFYTDFPQAALVSNKSYIYMVSGIYCIDPPMNQDLSWSPVDAASLNGSTESDPSKPNYNKYHTYNPDGVTLYIKEGGGFAINGTSPTFLDATTDPDSEYQGYLIILEGVHTDHPTCTLNGGANIEINGMIFAPYCNFVVNGTAGETASINAQLIGWDIKINGQNEITFNYDPAYKVVIKRRVGLMR
jgi:hypothetical protein